MSSRGLASLLAIPPALRPVLLQALTLATRTPPPSALVSPAVCARAQCRWKHTTPRSPLKKKLKRQKYAASTAANRRAGPSLISSKKAAPSAASSRPVTPSGPPKRDGPSKGKKPNSYSPGPRKLPRVAPFTAVKEKNSNDYPQKAKSLPKAPRTAPRGKNPNGYPTTRARAPTHAPSNERYSGSYPSRDARSSDSYHSRDKERPGSYSRKDEGNFGSSHTRRDDYSRSQTSTTSTEKTRSSPKVKMPTAPIPPVSSIRAYHPPAIEPATIPETAEMDWSEAADAEETMSAEETMHDYPDSSGPPTALSFLPPPPTEPLTATPAPPPTKLDLIRTATIFRDAKFLYSAPRFLNLPINTRMPEICILGRSNAGKSTLINALGGFSGKRAGRVTVTSHNKLAITSATAGCTKTMNAYGFGPPGSVQPLTRKQQAARKDAGLSRSAKRKMPLEAMPKHNLVLMDMPGYGMNSRADWGAEILKYLQRREILSGAVLLIDAVAGVKDGDRSVLEVLRDAGLTTSIVLTKADKLVGAASGDPAAWRGSARIRAACEHMWEEVRRVEKAGKLSSWWENDGWTPEIFVTGAGASKTGGMGVEGARVAIARLAGLVAEPAREVAKAPVMVPYDQIVFAVPSSMPKFEVNQVAEQDTVRERRPAVGRGRTLTRSRLVRMVAKPPPDAMQIMQAAVHSPPMKGKLGKASF